jgi:tRNA pseudouridine55 synthase
MLRRTRVGPYRLGDAHGLAELAAELRVIPLAEAAAAAFPVRPLTEAEAQSLSHGASLSAAGAAGPVAALAPDGTLVALVEERDGRARPLAVFVP